MLNISKGLIGGGIIALTLLGLFLYLWFLYSIPDEDEFAVGRQLGSDELSETDISVAEVHATSDMRLHDAAIAGDTVQIKHLIDSGLNTDTVGADFNRTSNPYRFTPLHLAAATGSTAAISALLAAGADIEAEVDDVRPLHLATRYGNVDAVKTLITAGADVNAICDRGLLLTPLHLALDFALGHARYREFSFFDGLPPVDADFTPAFETFGALLAAGADPNVIENLDGTTPLIYSAKSPSSVSLETTVALLAAKADPDFRGHHGNDPIGFCAPSALHEAAKAGSVEKLRLLIASGANVNALDHEDKTPLDYATPGDALRVLHMHGAEASADYLALHRAASIGDIASISDLIALGVHPDRFSGLGLTPLHVAVFNCHERAVAVLLSLGADPNALKSASSCGQDNQYHTPLEVAASYASAIATAEAFSGTEFDFNELRQLSHVPMWRFTPFLSSSDCQSEVRKNVIRFLLTSGARPRI